MSDGEGARPSGHSGQTLSPPPYSVRSLAERWSCSEGMIRKMIKDGTLQCFTIGTLIRIPVAEVERIELGDQSLSNKEGSARAPSTSHGDGRNLLPRARRPISAGIDADAAKEPDQ